MKLPKEIRQAVNRQRSKRGKKNGVIKYIWEGLWLGLKLETNKRNKRRENGI